MTIPTRGAMLLFLGLALASLACNACNVGPKLTQAHFEQIHEGMTTAEVKALIGEPTGTLSASLPILGSVTRYTYDDGKSHAELVFRDDRLRVKTGSIGR